MGNIDGIEIPGLLVDFRQLVGASWLKLAMIILFAGALPACVTATSRPFLWRVNGHEKTCYLLGTIHSGKIKLSQLPQSVMAALHDSQVVLLEASDSEPRTSFVPRDLTKSFEQERLPGGESLRIHLSAKAWKQLEAKLPNDVVWLNRYRPSVAFTYYDIVTRIVSAEDVGPDGKFFVLDSEIDAFARNRRITVVSLDAGIDLNPAMSGHFIDRSVDFAHLNSRLEEDAERGAPPASPGLDATLESYRNGDLAAFEPRLETDRDRREYESTISARNKAWFRKIKPALQNGRCFIAVGIGHLTGPGSLLALIAGNGFEVLRAPP